MAYVVVEDFRLGLDTRRSLLVAPAGSLQRCQNAHINRGGEIEKRKALVAKYALPVGTFGLATTGAGVFVFGSGSSPVGLPAGVTYQQLAHPSGSSRVMTEILDVTVFDGKVFAIAKYDNGNIFPFYNGTLIAAFQAGSGQPVAGLEPTCCLAFGKKIYVGIGSKIYFCTVDDPTSWNGTGAGNIPLNNTYAGSTAVNGIGVFGSNLVFYAGLATQIWYIDPDPDLNRQLQTLPNIGTTAQRSVVQFGDTDSFMLAYSGVRSIRPRSGSDNGTISDIGTPVDTLIIAAMRAAGATATAAAAGNLDPNDGRYMLAIGGTVYCFTYFDASKISAWSTYVPGFTIADWANFNNQVFCRSGDTIYLLGGDTGEEYDTSEVIVDLPYIDARKSATMKSLNGIDIALEGVWDVYVGTDPENPDTRELVGTVRESTFQFDKNAMDAIGPAVQIRLVNNSAGAAKVSMVVVHYEPHPTR
jgi:hypothetical protein